MKALRCLKLSKRILVIILLFFIFVFGCIQVYDNKLTDANMSNLCIENWTCDDWMPKDCPYGEEKQTRNCFDLAECNTNEFKPETKRSCEYTGPCIEEWECGEWTECDEGKQVRECVDKNDCNTFVKRPETQKTCEMVCKETWYCTSWTECNGEYVERECWDSHNCGTLFEKPITKKDCD
jgi:hypothetical protein